MELISVIKIVIIIFNIITQSTYRTQNSLETFFAVYSMFKLPYDDSTSNFEDFLIIV